MGSSLQRLIQIAKPNEFDDQKSASEISNIETSANNFADFVNGLISQLKRIIHGNQTGNWHDDPTTIYGDDASLYGLLTTPRFTPDLVPDGETYVVKENYQYIVHDNLRVDGVLKLDGKLVVF
jgi:hypothetical protein